MTWRPAARRATDSLAPRFEVQSVKAVEYLRMVCPLVVGHAACRSLDIAAWVAAYPHRLPNTAGAVRKLLKGAVCTKTVP